LRDHPDAIASVGVDQVEMDAPPTRRRIRLRVAFNASWPVLMSLLKDIELATPALLVDELQLVRSSPPGTALGLRAQARSPRIPVIYIPSNPERAKLAEAGHGAILIKPFALEELLAAVNRLLGIRPVTGNDAEPAGGPCAQS
jgi:DNA-binding response OmpR family regulator